MMNANFHSCTNAELLMQWVTLMRAILKDRFRMPAAFLAYKLYIYCPASQWCGLVMASDLQLKRLRVQPCHCESVS